MCDPHARTCARPRKRKGNSQRVISVCGNPLMTYWAVWQWEGYCVTPSCCRTLETTPLPLSFRESPPGPVLQGRVCTQLSLHCGSSQQRSVSDSHANPHRMGLLNCPSTPGICSYLHYDDSGCGRGIKNVPRFVVLMLLCVRITGQYFGTETQRPCLLIQGSETGLGWISWCGSDAGSSWTSWDTNLQSNYCRPSTMLNSVILCNPMHLYSDYCYCNCVTDFFKSHKNNLRHR